ncbi:MAG: UvrD-helicase domain-containing protein [Planctomycetota bacterium]|nr:UvrD-helicase domain-containing protein [Planctomycetota bacterium]
MDNLATADSSPPHSLDPDQLTPAQRAAVDHFEGPLLILAGPGSGKTRVITRRMARLVERGVDPRQILAVTFTNKAAEEMAARVERLVGGHPVAVSTFHRFCARLLRDHAELVGLQANYTILDTTDQKQVVRTVLDELNLDAVHFPPARISGRISRAKNEQQTAESLEANSVARVGNHFQEVVARVYPRYQEFLLRANAVDFDDLLLHVQQLLTENPELRRRLDNQYRFVMVDEYQDTNLVQYGIVRLLSHDHPNLCVTGDPDQSIYGWRGARVDNILRFEQDYPEATVVRLEENFRSTAAILRSADQLIAHNQLRKAKSLITQNPEGDAVELLVYGSAQDEAHGIAARIHELVSRNECTYGDCAVFYRVNSMSRQLEQALSRWGIPYQVIAGVAFFERAEVKDLLGYLRLIENPADDAAFARVVNKPPRRIGKVTQSKLSRYATAEKINRLEAAAHAKQIPDLSKPATTALLRFYELIDGLNLADAGSVTELLRNIIDRTRYTAGWQTGLGQSSEQDIQRQAVIDELLALATHYDEDFGDDRSLAGFLEITSLVADTDAIDPSQGNVTLMTLHAAKGLEFPTVFVIGVEQNLLPHERSLRDDNPRELEEERRLLFVGMTRAIARLSLTLAAQRDLHGQSRSTIPSQFLSEMQLSMRDNTLPGDTVVPRPPLPDAGTKLGRSGMADSPLLTTGAALLNGTGEAATLEQGFAVGMPVRHPRYGPGTVVAVDGFARNRTVTVRFEDSDEGVSFQAAHCPLQPMGRS